MRLWKKKCNKDKLKNRLGFIGKALPVVQVEFADMITCYSENSSYLFLGIYDIVVNNFYKYDVKSFVKKLNNSSCPVDYRRCLEPFISNYFHRIEHSYAHKRLITELFRYYLIRTYPLIAYSHFREWPKNVGPSSKDIRYISSYCCEYFRQRYPLDSDYLFEDFPDPEDRIYYQSAIAEEMAQQHGYEAEQMQTFIYDTSLIWGEFYENFLRGHNDNIISFTTDCLSRHENLCWVDCRSYYINFLLRDWSLLGAFRGKGPLREELWNLKTERCQPDIRYARSNS